jgi:DNA-binding MarR family transcriptional regulator
MRRHRRRCLAPYAEGQDPRYACYIKAYMDLSAPANDLLDLVALVVRGVSANRDLSLTAVATLRSLDRQGAQRITALAAAEGVSQPSMTQLIQRLEQRGLVVRASDPADGRAALATLTDAGRAALADRRQRSGEQIAELLGDLPEADVEALAQALAAVLPALRDRLAADMVSGRP